MSRPRIENSVERAARRIVAAAALRALLAGCSDLYFDRREAIALGAGDALAANAVEQMVDPWPAHSGDTAIPGNGQQNAVGGRALPHEQSHPAGRCRCGRGVADYAGDGVRRGSSGSPTSSSSSTSQSQRAMTAIVISTRQRV